MDSPKRSTLKKLAAIGLTAGAITHVPYVFARNKVTIRVLGTHVTLQDAIRKQAMSDLGINIEFTPAGSAAVLQRASMDPSSFDLYEQWSNSINVLWNAGSIQPIEKKRLTYFNEINSLTKTGKLSEDANIGAGDAPFKILNVQPDGTLSEQESDLISFLPYVHNVDSFGYNTKFIKPGIAYETESWGWLLDEQHRGKVGIVNAPTIGLFDLALAAKAKGLVKINNIGAMTRIELDNLFKVLLELKRQGHFSGYWNSVPESVQYMKDERVHIESMFSPAVSALKGQGINVRFAAPKEGYRGWHGVMCLSSQTHDSVKDASYDYMNWWLSGWPGAFIARQGYYISNPQRSKPLLSQDEWDYWYDGKIANTDLLETNGNIAVRKGEQRNGGSYTKRFSNVAVWNTVMPTYDYSLQKWYELISR
ncbi:MULTISPECIES: extracellular solute-binding protein [unclassified Pseudoalteromonas]|uniref:ABC transporter substrate-binding protein n=1 Tax=unclassified Pseudoalteromonas TaxID=194690 RepID=UPI0011094287|nr:MULTISPECIES: extracellular solute-binding protein [unclassified Pseudoalteromonas]TMN81712.1 signal peptide prediction [Pseudoalteromonas sp. S410]TMN91874.1 signal peptide prediction [Pseudoalteromonas sp. S408]TMN96162.1 signal peptide prediction [Pseudoalteromonas sp. S409]TMN98470.1 signal peptide prediction [Pseudoalteromonas sp. S407]TMO09676.1 signal peptide prediction [Pseudoalteromonas sp. S186]